MIMTAVAFLLGLILCLLLGVPYIDFLEKKGFGQFVKSDVLEGHAQKSGTPTTGGVFIVAAIIISSIITLMLAQKLSSAAIIMLFTLFFYSLAGFQDDFLKFKGKANKGLSARGKFWRQIAIAFLPALFITLARYTSVKIGYTYYDLGWFYPVFAIFVITGASNAFNLTDGLDGLASASGVPTFLGCAVIALITSHFDVAIIAAATAGALIGFLKYNKPKAKVFMGDTGSLAIGSLMGTLAVMGKFEFWLLIIAGIFVFETLSVIMQVTSFKLTGKRIFKMSPIHHHFELSGWSEVKIVKFFTLISVLFTLIGVLMFTWFHFGLL